MVREGWAMFGGAVRFGKVDGCVWDFDAPGYRRGFGDEVISVFHKYVVRRSVFRMNVKFALDGNRLAESNLRGRVHGGRDQSAGVSAIARSGWAAESRRNKD